MPYKCANIKLSESQDRRRKLTEADKDRIREMYANKQGSYQALADQFGVSKSAVCIICNPQRAEKVKQRVKDHWRDYSDTESHTKAVRNLRAYKQGLYLAGKLIEEKEK